MDHKLDWMEIAAADMDKAAQFYSDVFGWQMMDFAEGYKVFIPSQDSLCGGIRQIEPDKAEGTPAVIAYVEVADIDAKLQEIEAAGGNVEVPRFEVSPEVGWVAFFRPPGGVMVGLHQAPARSEK